MTEKLFLCLNAQMSVFINISLVFFIFHKMLTLKLILKHLTPSFHLKCDWMLSNFDSIYIFSPSIIVLIFIIFFRENPQNYGATTSGTKTKKSRSVTYCVHGKKASDCCNVETLGFVAVQPQDCEYNFKSFKVLSKLFFLLTLFQHFISHDC